MSISERLKQNVENGRLAHAYLFWGWGQAKLELALSLANYLETNLWLCDNHKLIDGRVFNDGGIDEAREIRRWLWQKPMRSKRRTAIIAVGNDGLTAEAQNALLKVTEEPPPAGLVLLVVDNPERLWPTLVSRFQKIYIPHLGGWRLEVGSERELVNKYLKGAAVQRKYLIKEILDIDAENENNARLCSFIRTLLLELDKDPIGNFPILKELSYRWMLINQFNLNKKLQLEAVSNKL